MTAEQLNEYLASIGGLEDGHYANRPPIVDCGFMSIKPGWYQLVHDLIKELVALGWDKEICQVKEKFGGLRFYTNGLTQPMHDAIAKCQVLSYQTCEVCGEPGALRKGPWLETLCDQHAAGRDKYQHDTN